MGLSSREDCKHKQIQQGKNAICYLDVPLYSDYATTLQFYMKASWEKCNSFPGIQNIRIRNTEGNPDHRVDLMTHNSMLGIIVVQKNLCNFMQRIQLIIQVWQPKRVNCPCMVHE
jgi:hypothetical protein